MIRFLNRWRDRRRRIFVHRAGRRTIKADPVIASLALHRHGSYLPRHLDEALAGDAKALQTTARTACDVFGVALWQDDGKRGLTLVELLGLMVAFDGYTAVLRQQYESLADTTALYGGDVPSLWRRDYEAYAGLWLNRHREHVRIADAPRLGIEGAFGQRHLGWFAAIAESQDEAALMYEQHRAEVASSHQSQ